MRRYRTSRPSLGRGGHRRGNGRGCAPIAARAHRDRVQLLHRASRTGPARAQTATRLETIPGTTPSKQARPTSSRRWRRCTDDVFGLWECRENHPMSKSKPRSTHDCVLAERVVLETRRRTPVAWRRTYTTPQPRRKPWARQVPARSKLRVRRPIRRKDLARRLGRRQRASPRPGARCGPGPHRQRGLRRTPARRDNSLLDGPPGSGREQRRRGQLPRSSTSSRT